MKHLPCIQAAVITAFLSLSSFSTQAQAPAPEAAPTVVRVKGLNPAMRDAVVAELASTQGLRLSYACVPAGILVFEQVNGSTANLTRSRSIQALEKHAQPKNITVLPISLLEAEQQCANVRNQ